jgi:hypothetical protein
VNTDSACLWNLLQGVIPAQAGIQSFQLVMESIPRGDDPVAQAPQQAGTVFLFCKHLTKAEL